MAEPSPWDRVVEMARISLENPVAMAVLRLHHEEYGSCAECGIDSNKSWPCPTWLAIEQVAARPREIVIDPAEAVKRMPVSARLLEDWAAHLSEDRPVTVSPGELPGHPLVRPKENADGTA